MIDTILQKVLKKIHINLNFIFVIYVYYIGFLVNPFFNFFIICEIIHFINEIINLSYFKRNFYYYIFNRKFKKKENLIFYYKSGNKEILNSFKKNYFKTLNIIFEKKDIIKQNIFSSSIILSNLPSRYINFNNLFTKKVFIKKSNQLKWSNYPLNERIKTLSLRNNSYLSFYGNYHNLRTLILNNNSINSLKLSCPKLTSLNVSNNQLSSLNLQECLSLKYLIVSDNNLESLKIINLEYLDISNNQFVVLPLRFQKINYLSIKNNPIIPNLNHPGWNNFFNCFYPEFYQNNLDIEVKNIYLHPELVHNPYLQNSTRMCLEELYEIFKENKIPVSTILVPEYQIGFFIFQEINFTLKNLVDTILFLSKNNRNIINILLEEIEDGHHYCLSGKISRIINSIMGFNLIKNKIMISRNDEIMIQYDKLKNKLLKKYFEENNDFHKEFNEEFSKILDELDLSPQTHENWKSGLD